MKQNYTSFRYIAILLCVLFFQFSNAQTVTVSDPTPGALTDYTFKYTLGNNYPANENWFFNFNVDPTKNSAYVPDAPTPADAYPIIFPASIAAADFVVIRNGNPLVLDTDYTVTFSESSGDKYKVYLKPLSDLSIGDEMEVTINNVFNNPIGIGEYVFTWGTFHNAAPADLPYGPVETFQASFLNTTNTIYMADTAPSALTDYTFLYTTTTTLASSDRLFSLDKPASYGDFQTTTLSAANVIVELNGTELTFGSDYTATGSGTQILIDASIALPAGSILKVELKQLITNPTGGEYIIPFQTTSDSFQDVVYVGSIVTASDTAIDALTDYTFKYQIMTDIPSVSNTRIFNLDLDDISPAYPDFSSTGITASVELNGVVLDPTFYSFGVSSPDLNNISITLVGKHFLPAGAKFVVTVSQAITNPSTLGDYDFTFKTGYLEVVLVPSFGVVFNPYETFQNSVNIGGTLSSPDFDQKGFSLYPNPVVNDVLYVKSAVVIKNITVYNVVGQQVYSASPNAMESVVNLAPQAKGVYFVKLVSENDNTKTLKVVKN